jgi:hypothetical protein
MNNYIKKEEHQQIKKYFLKLLDEGVASGRATMLTATMFNRHHNTIRKLVEKWLKHILDN